tara:strand:- start:316 stop:870 length:555 start_codon:yes stop_codon:yes gene_type:complete
MSLPRYLEEQVFVDYKIKNYSDSFFNTTSKFLPLGPKTPQGIFLFVQKNLRNLYKEIKEGKYKRSRNNLTQQVRSTVVAYNGMDLEEAAYNSEFVELLVFDDLETDRYERCIVDLNISTNAWYVITATNSLGECTIINYPISGTELVKLIVKTYNDVSRPFQELLAYRTNSLRDAVIIACSKPF